MTQQPYLHKPDDLMKLPAGKPLPNGVQPYVAVNDQGSYYAPDGTFMSADGTRSIFDDADE